MQLPQGPEPRRQHLRPAATESFSRYADVIKLLSRKVVIPSASNKVLFRLAPMITLIRRRHLGGDPAGSEPGHRRRQRRAAVRAGAHVGGRVWRDPRGLASNSKYAFLGRYALGSADSSLREFAMGFAQVGVIWRG
jgi:NADH-quinone oxidoreductase subunit H